MPATTILSNNPVNSVFSNDNSHFTYRHIDFSIELLLSSGTDLLGMVPLIPNPFWAPMAVSFIGGLMLATAIGLLVLPAMYCWWYKIDEPQTQLEEADN